MGNVVIRTLRDLRNYVGYTQEQVASRLDIDQATYSRYENADQEYVKKHLSIMQVSQLALLYGLDSLDEVAALIDGRYDQWLIEKSNRTFAKNLMNILNRDYIAGGMMK